nr:cysteine dioxygenase family protein [Metabacillus mangrovi]
MNVAVLNALKSPDKADLKEALRKLDCKLEDVLPELNESDGKPYYRKLLFQNDEVELLVMNWSALECAPHDHGESHGWIQVLSGVSKNTVFEARDRYLPRELFEELHEEGRLFFAPRKGVHKMKAEGGGELVTLHLYAPPITGMKVYDLEACAACVVSDDCGAWWPEEQRQRVKEIRLAYSENS